MRKTTYLLGAGASYNALPIVKSMQERMQTFTSELMTRLEKVYGKPGFPYPQERRPWPQGPLSADFLQSLDWLRIESARHASIDTLAKKMFLKNDHESKKNLLRLKATLSCYLLYLQAMHNVDYRYDSFLASIMNPGQPNEPKLPDWLNIVTWNYDLQLEKSYYEFCGSEATVDRVITRNPCIVRLNGLCGQFGDNTGYLRTVYSSLDDLGISAIDLLFAEFMKQHATITPSISFAWENIETRTKAANLLRGTQILVVIGYSFPFFNRMIDKEVLSGTKGSLVKVFIQAPVEDHADLKDRLGALLPFLAVEDPNVLHLLKGLDQFYIPDEVVLG